MKTKQWEIYRCWTERVWAWFKQVDCFEFFESEISLVISSFLIKQFEK